MRLGPRRAADTLFPLGRLAQLGERRLDKAEVTGSSPVSPTLAIPVAIGDRGVFGAAWVPMRYQFLDNEPRCVRWAERHRPDSAERRLRGASARTDAFSVIARATAARACTPRQATP